MDLLLVFWFCFFDFFLITMQVINTKKKMKKKKYVNSGTVSLAQSNTHSTKPPFNICSFLINVNLCLLDKGCNACVVLFIVR